MPRIENISKQDCILGWHSDPTWSKTVLIQICEVNDEFCTPKCKEAFYEIWQFKFEDTEDCFDIDGITDLQAKQIAEILKDCYKQGKDVIVHCFAGICRSGAVVACAEELGFEKCDNFKLPNSLVKRKIMQALGLGITKETSAFNQLDVTTEE